jgi:hypothetical protein
VVHRPRRARLRQDRRPLNTRPPVAARVLVVVGAACAALGLVAGHLNRELLDGPTFANHVDEIRRDEEVATAVGRSISEQLVLARPDLVAIRPLVDQVSTQVAGGDLLSGPTRAAAEAAHRALTESDADSIALRIADAGAVVSGVLGAVAPERAPNATNVSVTLAQIGDQAFASTVIAIARVLGVLAWLLPLLALVSFVVAIVLSRDRWRTAASAGRALMWSAAAVGFLLVVGGFLVRRLDDDTLGGATARAAWSVMIRPMWWGVAILGAFGLATVLACDSAAPSAMARYASRLRVVALGPPQSPFGVAVRAIIAILIGVAAIVDPIGLLEPLIVLAGVALILYAITEFARLAAPSRMQSAEHQPAAQPGPRRRWLPVAVAALAGVLVVGAVVAVARPGRDVDASAANAGSGTVCNGHAELCDRRFDDVAYVASHNSMSVAREPGWYLAEQVDPIPLQLDQGVRALLVDVWSGRPAGSVVRTAEGSYAEAREIAERELGPEVVDAALRIADSIAGTATGPEARFLCHGLCETGSTPLLDMLGDLRGWLAANPDEVVTLFIEDHVDAELIAADVEAAGLLPLVHEPVPGEPWPTLGEMIRSGRRLVVMLEEGDGGSAAPWLVNGFEYTQDTPYTFPTVDSFSCEHNRGPADAPLLLLNHWLSGFTSLVTDAQLVNARDVLLPRAQQCELEREMLPNFVAVNYVALGDVNDVVATLNGVE